MTLFFFLLLIRTLIFRAFLQAVDTDFRDEDEEKKWWRSSRHKTQRGCNGLRKESNWKRPKKDDDWNNNRGKKGGAKNATSKIGGNKGEKAYGSKGEEKKWEGAWPEGRNVKERSRSRKEGKRTQGKRVKIKESTWMGSGGCVPDDWGCNAYQ